MTAGAIILMIFMILLVVLSDAAPTHFLFSLNPMGNIMVVFYQATMGQKVSHSHG
jgi:hypothetical protein